MNFNDSIKIILRHEGGYVNDPKDPGGETNFGIAKRYHPNVDIKNLTAEQASEIYYHEYWLFMKLDAIKNNLLRLHMFDMGVNAGTVYAVRLLQQVLGITVDGIMGPKTIAAANAVDDKTVSEKYAKARIEYYTDLVKRKPERKKFLIGWVNRVLNTKYA